MKKVSKMDEMDRNILLRSESLAYKFAVIVLSLWVIFLLINPYLVILNIIHFLY